MSLLNKRGQEKKHATVRIHSDGHFIEETVQESAEFRLQWFYWKKNPTFTALHVSEPKLATLWAQSLLVLLHLSFFGRKVVSFSHPASIQYFIC